MKTLLPIVLISLAIHFASHAQDYYLHEDFTYNEFSGQGISDFVKTDVGGYMMVGSGDSDCIIIKISSDGSLEWKKQMGGSEVDYFSAIAKTHDGHYVAAARTKSDDGDLSAHGNLNDDDLWVVKFDDDGNIIWDYTYGGNSADRPASIFSLASGEIIITGQTSSYDNGVDVADASYHNANGTFWIVKLDSDGTLLDNAAFGNSSIQRMGKSCIATDGGYLMSGTSRNSVVGDATMSGNGDYDAWIVKVDSDFNFEWESHVGGASYDVSVGVHPTSDGGFISYGQTESNDIDLPDNYGGDYDLLVFKGDQDGNVEWVKNYGGTGGDYATDATISSEGNLVISSWTNIADHDVSINYGSSDIWILTIDPDNGDILTDYTLGGDYTDNSAQILSIENQGFVTVGKSGSSPSMDGSSARKYADRKSWSAIWLAEVRICDYDERGPNILSTHSDKTVSCSSTLADYRPDLSSYDECDASPATSQSPAPGSAITEGMTVTLTSTDASGNESETSFDIFLSDSTDPTITCPADQSIALGDALPDYTTSATASDNCDASPDISQSPLPGTAISSATVVTLTVTDEAGNDNTCTFTVSVISDDPPTITCPGDQNVTCGSTLADYTGLASASDDNDPSPAITQSPSAGTAVTDGMTVTLTATDDSSNTDDCSFQVFIDADIIAPTFSGVVDQTLDCSAVLPDYTAAFSVTDNCDATPSVTQSPLAGTSTTDGMTVTLTAVDDASNSVTASFSITLTDITIPTLTGVSDQTQSCGDLLADYTATFSASDDCDASPSVTQTPAAGTAVSDGMIVTLTVSDASGNDSDYDFNISLVDNSAPQMTGVTDQSVNCSDLLPDYTAAFSVSDDCDASPNVSQSPAPGSAVTDGMIVTLTASDALGNSGDYTLTVHIDADITAPTFSGVVDQTLDCSAVLPDYTAAFSVTDNCDATPSVTQSPLAGTSATDGMTVTLTAVDDAGNSQDYAFAVLLEDTEQPHITCLDEQVLACGSELPDYSFVTITDNCDTSPLFSQSPVAGTIITSDQSVTLTATDAAGNTQTCTVIVRVEDTIAPDLICPSDAELSCSEVLPDFASSLTPTSVCDEDNSYSQSPLAGTPVTDGMTITLTAQDASGNSSTCQFQVYIVEDQQAPEISCIEAFSLTCGEELLDYTDQLLVDDDCSDEIQIIQSPPAGTVITEDTALTFTATDEAGNENSCSTTVYVDDIYLDAGGDQSITEGESVELSPDVDRSGAFSWSPAFSLSQADIANPIASPGSTTTYALFFRDENGCEAVDQVTIEVRESSFQKGFSPNGDGINDSWQIKGIEEYPNNTVKIYNQWGDKIFEIFGYDNRSRSFDGHANQLQKLGGGLLPEGTYFYQISISGSHNLEKTQGFLILKK